MAPRPAHEKEGAEQALRVFEQLGGEDVEFTEHDARRVFCLVTGLNYLDKTALSYASVTGIMEHAHITGQQYSWLGSLFYFGYLVWLFPAGRLLQIFPIGKYIGITVVLWGVVLTCFAAVQNFAGAAAIRFMLGVLEASNSAGFALLNSQWWTKPEHISRICIWTSFNGVAQVAGGLIAYGVARGDAAHPLALAPWRVIFLITGLLTVMVGVFYLFIVPDNQASAWWLNPKDRLISLERVRVNQQGIGNKQWKPHQFKEVFQDPFTYASFLFALVGQIPNGGLSNFFNLLIKGFGYSSQQSLVLAIPSGGIEIVILVIYGLYTEKHGNRILWSTAVMLLSIAAAALLVGASATHPEAGLVGFYFTVVFIVPFTAVLSLISTNITGYTKKTTVSAIYYMGYCCGNIIGAQTFRARDAPEYRPAKVIILVCFSFCAFDAAFIYWWFWSRNKQKAARRCQPGYIKLERTEWADLTDWENTELVYAL